MATSTSPTTMKKIERAHQMYREGKYEEALGYYTEALSMAKTKPQKIALHSNRAACFLKLHLFQKAAEECTWVLELDHKHTGALMLRAQTLVTLKEYQSALFDVNRLIELNPSSEVYRNLQARLKTQLALAPIPEAEAELEEEEEDKDKYETELKEEEDDNKDEAELKEDNEGEQEYEAELKDEEMEEQNEREGEESEAGGQCTIDASAPIPQKAKLENVTSKAEVATSLTQKIEKSSDQKSLSWQTIAKPKGHSRLDYSRWDSVEDDSSEDEEDDDDDECQPQYRFRVRKVGVHAVK